MTRLWRVLMQRVEARRARVRRARVAHRTAPREDRLRVRRGRWLLRLGIAARAQEHPHGERTDREEILPLCDPDHLNLAIFG